MSSTPLVQAHATVHVLAYGGAPPAAPVAAHKRIIVHTLPPPPAWLGRLPRMVGLPLKAVVQAAALLWALFFALPRPAAAIVQTPPALPTLPVLIAVATLRRFRLIIDWHNYAFSLMALTLGPRHPLVALAARAERAAGRAAGPSAAHLAVTAAMARELEGPAWRLGARGGGRVRVFHDRPPRWFAPPSADARHALLRKLAPALAVGQHPDDWCAGLPVPAAGESDDVTVLTWRDDTGAIRPRTDRPALVISSTSWTPDEDFGVLLAAAVAYDQAARTQRDLPKLLIVVTGRGPQRAHYERAMAAARLRAVAFRTLWLDAADYPVLLGCADVGVSLHSSSSGVDLPMKVVDMFGAGTPALAAGFACVGELVAHGANGLVFDGPAELTRALADVLTGLGRRGRGVAPPAPGGAAGYGDEPARLAEMRATVARSRAEGWEEAWDRVVKPLFV